MKLYRSLKLLSGILMVISSITIFVMIFLEPETIGVFFNFDINIRAENLGEAIAGFAVGIGMAVGLILTSLLFGAIYLIIYFIIGIATIFVKKGKGLFIFAIIVTGISMFFEIRTLMILIAGEKSSIILPTRLAIDAIILGISFYGIIALSKFSKKTEATANL